MIHDRPIQRKADLLAAPVASDQPGALILLLVRDKRT
jgi:hypothetical protein